MEHAHEVHTLFPISRMKWTEGMEGDVKTSSALGLLWFLPLKKSSVIRLGGNDIEREHQLTLLARSGL